MAMLSITTPTELSHLFPTTHRPHRPLLPFITPLRLLPKPHRHHLVRPISATQFPSPPSTPSGEVYQPFRPPPSPLPPRYRSLNPVERLDILRNRLGLWYDYAPLIPSLTNDGFTPPSIEEATGISGVEQNRLVVAAQVRDSIISSAVEPEVLAYFDLGGAELLYELRLLNAPQRVASARRVVERRLDPKATQQLARAVKDFSRRRGDPGWESFSAASPADCLAYSYFRLSREALSPADRAAALERALEEAETEAAKKRIGEELAKATGKGKKEEDDLATKTRLPVVRLRYGEVAESTSVATLPVCDAAAGETGVAEAPSCRAKGDFGVVTADKPWEKWVVLPGWKPVVAIREGGEGVAVAFADARMLPWRTNKWEKEEAVLVVVDRTRKDVADEAGFYLVGSEGGGGGLAVEAGSRLREAGVQEALGMVVLVVRPPRDDLDDQIADDEWD